MYIPIPTIWIATLAFVKVLFISFASNRNKAIQKQKDTLLNNLKQFKSRHKYNSISDLEQNIKQYGNRLHLLDINKIYRKLNFQTYFGKSNKSDKLLAYQLHKEQDKITIIYEGFYSKRKDAAI